MKMKTLTTSIFLIFVVLLFSSRWALASSSTPNSYKQFFQCLSFQSGGGSNPISKVVYTHKNSSYSSILDFSIQNLVFTSPSTPKPFVIITPLETIHIQSTVTCARKYEFEVRVRGGGHDFEGLSFVSDSDVPFIVIDLIKMNHVNVDVKQKTAWVQAGATLGEVYYSIGSKTDTLAFPAGVCPTVGVGGHISGGGYGFLLRKYGLAADNVIDALLIDVNGRLLDRESMGEDVFWAIRGSGGNTFGVVVAWKLQLVEVPSKVTICNVNRTLEQGGTYILQRWQQVANKFPEDLFTRVNLKRMDSTMRTTYETMYLGRIGRTLQVLQDRFPELGVVRSDCQEIRWIQAALYYGGYDVEDPIEILRNRTSPARRFFPTAKRFYKGKSDYVQTPIPINAWPGIYKKFFEDGAEVGELVMSPYGGKMDEIPETAIPFPHRAGNLYIILYTVDWAEEENENAQSYINWLRRFYSHMAPYVSKNPRRAYVNYRDLDLGSNSDIPSVEEARVWGFRYFKNNFNRLVRVKTAVDPTNFFRNEQSVPPRVSLLNNGQEDMTFESFSSA